MAKWAEESCARCGKTITSRMKPSVFRDRIVCLKCWEWLSYHEGPPSERQILFAMQLGISDPEQYTHDQISALIDEALANRDSGHEYTLTDRVHQFANRIGEIWQIAVGCHVAEVVYHAHDDDTTSTRLVEVYQLQAKHSWLYLLVWQIEPSVENEPGWRSLRLDRILSIKAMGRKFVPRISVSIPKGYIHEFEFEREDPSEAPVVLQYNVTRVPMEEKS